MKKNNYIKVENKKGLKKEYRVLLKIEAEDDKTYIVYTDDKRKKDNSLITYISLVKGKKYIDPNDDEVKCIKKLLSSLDKEKE